MEFPSVPAAADQMVVAMFAAVAAQQQLTTRMMAANIEARVASVRSLEPNRGTVVDTRV